MPSRGKEPMVSDGEEGCRGGCSATAGHVLTSPSAPAVHGLERELRRIGEFRIELGAERPKPRPLSATLAMGSPGLANGSR